MPSLTIAEVQAKVSNHARAATLAALRMDYVAVKREPCQQHLDLVSERSQIAGDRLSKINLQIESLINQSEFDLRFLLTIGLLTVELHLWLESIEPDTPLFLDLAQGFKTLQGIAARTLAK